MAQEPVYHGFLGCWELIPESCIYEQSDPPQSGAYRITKTDEGLRFDMSWVDISGESHEVSFCGVPDGSARPFNGADLADALSVTAVSERDLRSSAFYKGKERMVAQRQLDDSGQAMRVVQLVRLPDGTSPVNVSVYRRQD